MRVKPAILAVVVLAVSLAGCTIGGAEDGTLAVYVKDAPADEWRHLNVTVTRVQVHQSMEAESPTNGTRSDWVTVMNPPDAVTVDLLRYRGEDARALLGTADVPAAEYTQLVMTVSGATGVRADTGEEVDITVSSGNLRLVRPFNVTDGDTTRVVLDFDLDRPGVLVQQGNGAWRFTPVIGRVIVQEDAEGPEESVPAE